MAKVLSFSTSKRLPAKGLFGSDFRETAQSLAFTPTPSGCRYQLIGQSGLGGTLIVLRGRYTGGLHS
jgi:hypothetical protein